MNLVSIFSHFIEQLGAHMNRIEFKIGARDIDKLPVFPASAK